MDFHGANKEMTNAAQAAAIGKMNALVSEYVYARSTPMSWSDGTTSWICVAPTWIMVLGSTPVVYLGMDLTSALEKTFCAMEMATAPPSELKNKMTASVRRLVGK